MAGDVIIVTVLTLLPMIVQLMAMSVYFDRMARALQRAADKPPFNAVVTIQALGPQPQAVARLLDRSTRLDLDEVDSVVDNGGGRLPLPMSWAAAQRLALHLRTLGAHADVQPR